MINSNKIHFYCDSSSHRNSQYMVAGGIAIRQGRLAEISQKILDIKASGNIGSEFKWSGYRGGYRRQAYEDLIDLCFSLAEQKQAALHWIIADFGSFAHKTNDDGSPESSVNRMYFQLCLHRLCKFYGKACGVYVYPDNGNDSAELIGFRDVLCARAYKTYKTKPNCVRDIKALTSHTEPLIQMADVVTGAIAALRNQRQLKAPKANLAQYVLDRSGHPDWSTDTLHTARFMTVWNFQHQERNPHRPRP
ncbi:DUF3800 domain-containing protein [Alphaproteobacteria bacterium HT1-32]|nr:DUF3800 domain-containing protein [Alphaproteobacteria bacterium HT1-32]